MKEFGPGQQLSAPGLSGKINARVLVAEDGSTNQKVISLRLEKPGCAVHVVQDGREAVQAARAAAFDVILMDHQMPVMHGFEATRESARTAVGTSQSLRSRQMRWKAKRNNASKQAWMTTSLSLSVQKT